MQVDCGLHRRRTPLAAQKMYKLQVLRSGVAVGGRSVVTAHLNHTPCCITCLGNSHAEAAASSTASAV